MDDERPRKWGRLKEWTSENSVLLNFCMVCLMFALTGIQTYQGWVAISDRAEQQRPRLSLQIKLEKIDDPTRFRILAPLEIGGTTDARRVVVKDHVTPDKPKQSDYISAVDLDWNSREGHLLGDVSPMEREREIYGKTFSQQHTKTILSTEESLYFVARLEYCDIQDNCYYFMRCAELGDTRFGRMVTYCGTRSGRLTRD